MGGYQVSVPEITLELEARYLFNWVPVLKSLYNFVLSVTQGPTGTWDFRVRPVQDSPRGNGI